MNDNKCHVKVQDGVSKVSINIKRDGLSRKFNSLYFTHPKAIPGVYDLLF